MYSLEIQPELLKKLEKLSKKNRNQSEIILKKADEIVENPFTLFKACSIYSAIHTGTKT